MSVTGAATGLLERIVADAPAGFALLHRPAAAPGRIEVLRGTVSTHEKLAELPVDVADLPGACHDVLTVLPYRQLRERGFACHDDAAPLYALKIEEQEKRTIDEALALLPDVPTPTCAGEFVPDDDAYAATVQRVLDDEIAAGAGANFVIKRAWRARVDDWGVAEQLALFRRLLTQERGAYWTFLVHVDGHVFVGATPERHVSLFDGTVTLNPISGTFRFGEQVPTDEEVADFLVDVKESGELNMVLDEELKMTAGLCESGGRARGPFLKEMSALAHTEYLIDGECTADVRDILRQTMFAPTVVGSPLENAARVLARHEAGGRGYYSGVVGLVSRDAAGGQSLDSAIMIRTADVCDGVLEIGVGATLVRDSDPAAEVAETRAKARGLRRALDAAPGGSGHATAAAAPAPQLAQRPLTRRALDARNGTLAGFWFGERTARHAVGSVAGRSVAIVDAEDDFTAMLAVQLRSLGLHVRVYSAADVAAGTADVIASAGGQDDLLLLGPGPGDPCDGRDPRVRGLRAAARHAMTTGRPMLAVCLSHQVVGDLLGLPVERLPRPNQGVAREVPWGPVPATVGFYNSFAVRAPAGERFVDGVGPVGVHVVPGTDEVYALRGPAFASIQFHPESVLSIDGAALVEDLVRAVLLAPATAGSR